MLNGWEVLNFIFINRKIAGYVLLCYFGERHLILGTEKCPAIQNTKETLSDFSKNFSNLEISLKPRSFVHFYCFLCRRFIRVGFYHLQPLMENITIFGHVSFNFLTLYLHRFYNLNFVIMLIYIFCRLTLTWDKP